MAMERWMCVVVAVSVVSLGNAANGASSLECSLNGVMNQGKCQCDIPWKGDVCAQLDFLPRKVGSVPAYGFSPNVTSWGGNIIQNDDGSFDMWVSEMANGCGLIHWGSNSRIIRATSESMDTTKPFVFKSVTLPVWAHNAAPVRAPPSHTACPGCYYLFHIGSGDGGHPVQCNNSTASLSHELHDVLRSGSNESGLVHRSRTPDGPWDGLPSIPHSGCNNPAPAFAKDGSLWVLCNSATLFKTMDPTDASKWELVAHLDLNDSPWTTGAKEYIRIEDPYIWQDPNENWHLLCHRYDYRDGYPANPNQTMPILVSGHAFSTDGIEWHYSMGPQPFDPYVQFEDGTSQNFSTFERPHLVFDSNGIPTHTVHGASPVWDQYGQHHPCEVCPTRPGSEHSCVVCKTSEYYSWTYTLTQALKTTVATRL